MVVTKAKLKRNARYPLLSNIQLIIDASGLATGTNNSYGDIDGSNGINSIKSLAPGPTGRDFTVNGSGVTYDPTTKSIAFNGSGRLRSGSASSVWDFLSYHASGLSSVKSTTYIVCKIGTSIKPSTVSYGLFGTNGGSSVSKGISLNYANNSTNEDTLVAGVTKGSSNQYIGRFLVPGSGPSNQFCVITAQMDGGSSGNRMRLFVNDEPLLFIEMLNNDVTPVTTPTYTLEIGGVGNAVLPLVGNIKEVVIAGEATSSANMFGFIRTLMNKHGIVRSRSNYLDVSTVPQIFIQDSAATYKLCGIISQNPTNKNQICAAYSVGGSHLYNADKKLAIRVSNNKGYADSGSFGSETTIYNPTDPASIQDCGGGFDLNGRMHIFSDVINSGSAGGCIGVTHSYSDDLSSWTNDDVTSWLPSDGLAAWRMYGNMVEANGICVKTFYKLTDHGDTTSSAIYVWVSTNRFASAPTTYTVKAASGTYINESSIAYLGGNSWVVLARNESTKEWTQYYSSDNCQTWTSQGDCTFGETVATNPNPPMLKTFTHNGVLCVAAYITNRDNDTAFVTYAKASSIIASGVSGWDLDTKLMWWKTNLAPWHYHYGDVVHLDDTIKAVGIYPYDNFPGAGGTTNKLNLTTMPTWHISKIESELGI